MSGCHCRCSDVRAYFGEASRTGPLGNRAVQAIGDDAAAGLRTAAGTAIPRHKPRALGSPRRGHLRCVVRLGDALSKPDQIALYVARP